MIVAKFGGTSLANTERFIRVAHIINEDPLRRIIVPSAPGKDGDFRPEKITELLIACGNISSLELEEGFKPIRKCFLGIAERLGVCIERDLTQVEEGLLVKRESPKLSEQWAASRGEWLSGKILSRYLDAEFVDAAEIMKFNDDGFFNETESYRLISQRLRGSERFVVPGFYGQDEAGRIRTFPRGGSDITGAYLAAGLNAHIYENWTDTNGVMTADPNIVPEARKVDYLLYEELAELGYSGVQVYHPMAVGPVWQKNIPINIRNSFYPENPGTFVWFFPDKHPMVKALMEERGFANRNFYNFPLEKRVIFH